jgi:predicted nuclease of predicted toxin-antitoxin system
MKVLVDMNLPPAWVPFLNSAGIDAAHWSAVGDPRASDAQIMVFARENGYLILTHDLDFSTLLSLAGTTGPSIVQTRTQSVLPQDLGPRVVQVLTEHRDILVEGAIVTIDLSVARLRLLPLRRSPS